MIDRIEPQINIDENGNISWVPSLVDYDASLFYRGKTITNDEFNELFLQRTYQANYLADSLNEILNNYLNEAIKKRIAAEGVSAEDLNNALADYYTATEIDNVINTVRSEIPDISNLATKGEIPDVSNFVTKDELPNLDDFDLSDYAKKTDIPDVSNFATKAEIPDISNLVTKDEIPDLDDFDLSDYAKKTDIPDISNLASKDEIPDISNLANKSEIPDISNLATKDELPNLDDFDLSEYAKKTDIPDISNLASKNEIPDVSNLASKDEIPDTSNFITNTVNNLTNYYTKDQVNAVLPTVNNGTLTIQKNGTNIATFSANQSGNATANIIIPTTASDVSALPNSTKYGASLSLSMNTSTYVVTVQLKDQDGNNLGTAQTIDLPLESVVVSGSYNNITKKVVLTLKDGSTVDFSVADLVSGLVSESSFNELEDRVGTNETSIKALQTNVNGLQNDLNSEVSARETAIISVNSVLDTKVDQKAGYGLSEENFTKVEKEKLAGLEATVGGVVALVKDYPSNNKIFYQYCSNPNAKVGDNIFIIYEYRTNTSTYYFKELRGVYGTITAKDPSYYTVSLYSSSTSLVWAELERNYAQTGQNTDGSMTQKAITDTFAFKTDVKSKTSELENDSGFITSSDVPTKLSELSTDENNQRVSSAEKTTWNNKSNFSGNYNDLTNKPTIPTKTSQLTNDSGFITSSDLPTKTSQLANDSGYLTSIPSEYVTDTELSTALVQFTQNVNTVLASAVKTDSSNQSIAGTKTFTGAIIVPDVTIA